MLQSPLRRRWRLRLAAAASLVAAFSQFGPPARGECMTLIGGAVVYDVTGCKLLEPEKVFDTSKEKYGWIGGLDPASRKTFLDTYRGLYVKGRVVKSKASMQGVAGTEGALGGEVVFMYIPPGTLQCPAVLGKRLAANLHQVCCEGGGDAPCLLDTSYELQQVQVMNGGPSEGKGRGKHSKDYLAADVAFNAKKYKVAAKAYEKLKVNGELDIPGYYHLGYAYRMLDQCHDALPALRHINELDQKKEIWTDDEEDAKKGTMLLARCYARLGEADNAVAILNSYLIEPAKFQPEIAESLKHGDFGYIHTTRDYRDYSKEAKKKLKPVAPK